MVSGTLALHNACDSFLVLLVESGWANGALLQPQSPQKQALAKLLIRQDLGGHHIALISKTWRSVSTADHPVIPISVATGHDGAIWTLQTPAGADTEVDHVALAIAENLETGDTGDLEALVNISKLQEGIVSMPIRVPESTGSSLLTSLPPYSS